MYTTQEIRDKITAKKLPEYMINEKATTYETLNDTSKGYAEPAMIEYKYNTSDGTISIAKNYGTTKDYLLSQEGCTSLGLNGTECSSYALVDYGDTYYDTLGVEFGYEHGLVNSNLNETIFGPYNIVRQIYTYVLFFVAIYYLLRYSIKNAGFFSKQSIMIVIGVLIPLIVNILGSFR